MNHAPHLYTMPTRSADRDFRGAHTYSRTLNIMTYQRCADFPLPRRGGNYNLHVDINNYCPITVDHWLSPAVTPIPAGLTTYSSVLSCVKCDVPYSSAVVCVEYILTMTTNNRCIAISRHNYELPGEKVKRRRSSTPSFNDMEMFVRIEEFTQSPVYVNEDKEVIVPGRCSNAYLMCDNAATYRFPDSTAI